MKKLLSLTLMVFGLSVMASKVQAAVGVRAPKESFVATSYTTAISSVTPFTVLESTTTSPFVIKKPGAVYQVTLGTGTAGAFALLFDTSTAVGLNTANAATITAQLGPRLFFGSTSANTTITFDPPLIFYNGLMVANSAATESGISITYEVGRGLSGQ